MGVIYIKKIIIFTIVAIFSFFMFKDKYDDNYIYLGSEIKNFYTPNIYKKPIAVYEGLMTAYGPDCKGCSGITASGYNVLNGNIYYNDKTYGNIRILAADKSLPFGTIVKIIDNSYFEEDIIGIVLDRGSAIGFSKKSYFDLLYKSEKDTETFGSVFATYEILRKGF